MSYVHPLRQSINPCQVRLFCVRTTYLQKSPATIENERDNGRRSHAGITQDQSGWGEFAYLAAAAASAAASPRPPSARSASPACGCAACAWCGWQRCRCRRSGLAAAAAAPAAAAGAPSAGAGCSAGWPGSGSAARWASAPGSCPAPGEPSSCCWCGSAWPSCSAARCASRWRAGCWCCRRRPVSGCCSPTGWPAAETPRPRWSSARLRESPAPPRPAWRTGAPASAASSGRRGCWPPSVARRRATARAPRRRGWRSSVRTHSASSAAWWFRPRARCWLAAGRSWRRSWRSWRQRCRQRALTGRGARRTAVQRGAAEPGVPRTVRGREGVASDGDGPCPNSWSELKPASAVPAGHFREQGSVRARSCSLCNRSVDWRARWSKPDTPRGSPT